MILVDTSGVLAAIDPRQSGHAATARALVRAPPGILSPFGPGGQAFRLLPHDAERGV